IVPNFSDDIADIITHANTRRIRQYLACDYVIADFNPPAIYVRRFNSLSVIVWRNYFYLQAVKFDIWNIRPDGRGRICVRLKNQIVPLIIPFAVMPLVLVNFARGVCRSINPNIIIWAGNNTAKITDGYAAVNAAAGKIFRAGIVIEWNI